MHIDEILRTSVGALAKRSGARITTSRTPPIYRPLLKPHYRPPVPHRLSRLPTYNPLSALAGCSESTKENMYRDLELRVVVRYLPGGQIVHMHSFPTLLVPLRFVP